MRHHLPYYQSLLLLSWLFFFISLLTLNLCMYLSQITIDDIQLMLLTFIGLVIFEVYSIDSSKMIGTFLEVSNLNQLFLKLNRFIRNQPSVFKQCFQVPTGYFSLSFFLRQKADMPTPKAQEAMYHLPGFMSSRKEISQLGIEEPTCSLRFGYLSTIIQ